jgi:Bifunctional DNA primase/polymerase, N-terminal
MTMAAFQEAAPAWAAAGIVPLPMDGKKPLVRHPDRFGCRSALRIVPKFPNANLGFWCGHFNRVTVVDVDSAADSELQYALDTFGPSPVLVRTASGKHHAYYRHAGERRRIRPIAGHAIDILGEGGLAVAPPSARPSGGRYEFVQAD